MLFLLSFIAFIKYISIYMSFGSVEYLTKSVFLS